MLEVMPRQVGEALAELGIVPGDNLLVHSAVQYLGRPQGGVGMYLQAIGEAVGWRAVASPDRFEFTPPSGILAVPAFNFGFARGEPYDPTDTPAQGMGAFSEYVRRHPQALRTAHPMQSLAVIGPLAADLAGRDTPSAFDPGSAFERLLELDFKLLLLGADIQAVSMLHYSEQRFQVPYRYWKDFTGPVRRAGGWETATYRMYARDLEMDARLSLHPVQERLAARDQWRARTLNYGTVAACRLADFVRTVDEFLAADPWSLVTNKEFHKGLG